MTEKKLSKTETIKENSAFLRGPIKKQLSEAATHFDEEAITLLKFHGTYQQDDRDLRQKLQLEGKEKAYSMMVRTKTPGGKVTWQQYLFLDQLADKYGNGTMRITTRQGIQFHGILKSNLKATMHELNQALITTLGACGDVVRNVCACPAPSKDRVQLEIQEFAKKISDHLLPKSNAYHEIWIADKPVSNNQSETEPIYGKTYLPRKFKIVIAYPGDNCVDIYAHDIGLVAVSDKQGLKGFYVLVGGGFGMTHRKPETHPILAQPLGYVEKEKTIEVCEAIVKVQRDHGNRENRAQARLKYLIEARGIDWFHGEVAKYTGYKLSPVPALDWSKTEDHLGWHELTSDSLYFGLFVENGRIWDKGTLKLRSGIKKLVDAFKTEIRFTPQQNILFVGIPKNRKSEFEAALRSYGISNEKEISSILRWSMACPATPTCGLAIAESERSLPSVIRSLEKELISLGLQDENITVRMTGCPNGCARPYSSEIGLVGSASNAYALFLAGNFEGTRLNQMVHERVKTMDVVPVLRRFFELFKAERNEGERFGDFCSRKGSVFLKEFTARAVSLQNSAV